MTLFIAEPSQILRARIINLLTGERGVEIAGTARNVSEALNGISRLRPDVLLLAFELYAGCNIDLIELIRASQPKIRVLLLLNEQVSVSQAMQRRPPIGTDFLVDISLGLERIPLILNGLIKP